uniref:Family with sequence similarity 151 member B n=1 Tax=Neogobius melanostomus TaxID=47308 RepID=A0A8C6SNW0_9GOBI
MKNKLALLCSLLFVFAGCLTLFALWKSNVTEEEMPGQTLKYFLGLGLIKREDAADITWAHAVNSKSKLSEALKDSTLMLEADVLMRGQEPREPIMAHPPHTDSDISLREWLQELNTHNDKGIKLDFKSLDAVAPSMLILAQIWGRFSRPAWLNADVLPGPGGQASPLDAHKFLSALVSLSEDTVLSLGWTTGWTDGAENPGYSWEMVRAMEQICRSLKNPVTFPVRAALMGKSAPQLLWLLQQSHRYSLTVWTGQSDVFKMEDLLQFRKRLQPSRVYYDLPDDQRNKLAQISP